jgi:hypothetical protein
LRPDKNVETSSFSMNNSLSLCESIAITILSKQQGGVMGIVENSSRDKKADLARIDRNYIKMLKSELIIKNAEKTVNKKQKGNVCKK